MASEAITPATYSGVHVLQQMDSYGQPVMRRAKDDYINATQVLRAAGFPKTQRTKILERDISGGVHEKVQGGFHMFQGTWVPLDTAIKLARKHGVHELLAPLFEFALAEGIQSDIFKNMAKFAKPYKIARAIAKVDARPASTRINHSSTIAAIFDDDEDDDEDELDGDPDEDQSDTETEELTLRASDATRNADDDTEEDASKTRESRRPRAVRASGSGSSSTQNQNTETSTQEPQTSSSSSGSEDNAEASSPPPPKSAPSTPQLRKQTIPPPSPKSTPAFASNLTVAQPRRGPGRPKGSKNRAGSGSPAPNSPRPSTRRLESNSPEKESSRASNAPIPTRSPTPSFKSLKRNERVPAGSSKLKESTVSGASKRVSSQETALQGSPGRQGSGDSAPKDDTADLMDPYNLLRRRNSSDSSSNEFSLDEREISVDFMEWGNNQDTHTRARIRTENQSFPSTDEAFADYSNEEDAFESDRVKKKMKGFANPPNSAATTLGTTRKRKRTKKPSVCASCGVFSARWKHRVAGGLSVVLCDPCGLKQCIAVGDADASAGMFSEYLNASDSADRDARVRETVSMEESEDEKTMGGNSHLDEVSGTPDMKRLTGLAEDSRNRSQKLKALLGALKHEDAVMDRAYRRAIVWSRQVRLGIFKGKENVRSSDEKEEGADDDEESLDADDEYGWRSDAVNHFIGAVQART
ncbi:hypothetical protein HDU77_011213 [Chytriomyces hyalinus]|nr:hypothetical protein HDU77_011213 [Chytriomyces hyalinus]